MLAAAYLSVKIICQTIKTIQMSKVKIDYMDAQEIADCITGIENDDLDMSITENAICEKFDCRFEAFHEIVEAIFERIDFGLSPLTQEAYVGIADKDKSMWHVKKEVNQQFIAGLINWATEGEKVPKNGKGFMRTISKGNKPEFEITIRRPTAESVKE